MRTTLAVLVLLSSLVAHVQDRQSAGVTTLLSSIEAKRPRPTPTSPSRSGASPRSDIRRQEQRAAPGSSCSAAGLQGDGGVAGMPTAFIANYGSGKPVIAIVGEFDALPGLSQDAMPRREADARRAAPGHGCGHHLFGTGSLAAAIAVKEWMVAGTSRHACAFTARRPRKAGRARSTWCARDCSTTWTSSSPGIPATATRRARRRTSRTSAGSSVPRHLRARRRRARKGRSALDAVEAMDNMVNMMREHIP